MKSTSTWHSRSSSHAPAQGEKNGRHGLSCGAESRATPSLGVLNRAKYAPKPALATTIPSVDHTVLKTRWNRLGDDASAVEMVDWCLTVDGRRRNGLKLRRALCIFPSTKVDLRSSLAYYVATPEGDNTRTKFH